MLSPESVSGGAHFSRRASYGEALTQFFGLWKARSTIKEAVANLKEALARDSSLTNALTVLGIDLIKLHRPDDARIYLERNCDLDAPVVEACLALGQASVRAHRFEAAIRAYRRVLADHPRSSKARYGLGFVYLAVYQKAVGEIAQQRGSQYLHPLADGDVNGTRFRTREAAPPLHDEPSHGWGKRTAEIAILL